MIDRISTLIALLGNNPNAIDAIGQYASDPVAGLRSLRDNIDKLINILDTNPELRSRFSGKLSEIMSSISAKAERHGEEKKEA